MLRTLNRKFLKSTTVKIARIIGIAVILSGLILHIPSNASAIQIGLTFPTVGINISFLITRRTSQAQTDIR